MEPALPTYGPSERLADAVVHLVGLALALLACLVLFATLPVGADLPVLLGLGIYGGALVAMLACSALYNLSGDDRRRRFYRRLDHAGIFLMIAGTYTPFTLILLGDGRALGLLALVWTLALIGAAVELAALIRSGAILTSAYLLLGWVIVAQIGPLADALSRSGLILLVAGGVLYTVGAAFHHWRSLPYHNAIWHLFVVGAAACHYLAVLREIVLRAS